MYFLFFVFVIEEMFFLFLPLISANTSPVSSSPLRFVVVIQCFCRSAGIRWRMKGYSTQTRHAVGSFHLADVPRR